MMPVAFEAAENGEGSSSTQDALEPDSGSSSDLEDPVLAHNRDHTLLNEDFLEDEPRNSSVPIDRLVCPLTTDFLL